ncbi:MAG: hypothetical protein WC839_02295 [Candidatus Paceibacterota bacterium]
MLRKNIILIIIFTIASAGFFANAQVRDTDIVLTITPEYPSPNQDVNATLNSYSVDLNKANITWLINNEEKTNGIGKKSFSFKITNSNSSTILSAIINTVDGQNISKSITISSTDIDMLWEAYDTYVPPFYKGKALAPSQGYFKIVAMPSIMGQTEKTNMRNLSYTWKKDSSVQTGSSGWGKNYLIFRNSYLDRENTAEVIVSDILGKTNTYGKVTLNTTNPKILFYKNNPSLGVGWETALTDGFTINSNGETIIAEPYFFSPKDINYSGLTFDWFLNGTKTETPNPKNILSIKPDTGQSGEAIIKIIINNTETLFQSMTKQINASF